MVDYKVDFLADILRLVIAGKFKEVGCISESQKLILNMVVRPTCDQELQPDIRALLQPPIRKEIAEDSPVPRR